MSTCPPFAFFGSNPANCHRKWLWTPPGMVSTRRWGRRGAAILGLFLTLKRVKLCNCCILRLFRCYGCLLSLGFGLTGSNHFTPTRQLQIGGYQGAVTSVCIRNLRCLFTRRQGRPFSERQVLSHGVATTGPVHSTGGSFEKDHGSATTCLWAQSAHVYFDVMDVRHVALRLWTLRERTVALPEKPLVLRYHIGSRFLRSGLGVSGR